MATATLDFNSQLYGCWLRGSSRPLAQFGSHLNCGLEYSRICHIVNVNVNPSLIVIDPSSQYIFFSSFSLLTSSFAAFTWLFRDVVVHVVDSARQTSRHEEMWNERIRQQAKREEKTWRVRSTFSVVELKENSSALQCFSIASSFIGLSHSRPSRTFLCLFDFCVKLTCDLFKVHKIHFFSWVSQINFFYSLSLPVDCARNKRFCGHANLWWMLDANITYEWLNFCDVICF